jgi:hypothetical protein
MYLLSSISVVALFFQAADPHMTSEERTKVIGLLKHSQEEFLSSIDGLTDAQWTYKPGPDRWSIGEIERVMLDRSHKATAPESIRPTGITRAQVIERFKAVRAQTLKFAQETDVPLKEFTSEHPFPVFNTLNAYDWLIYIPLHNMRHDLQIAEVKASPGYPK